MRLSNFFLCTILVLFSVYYSTGHTLQLNHDLSVDRPVSAMTRLVGFSPAQYQGNMNAQQSFMETETTNEAEAEAEAENETEVDADAEAEVDAEAEAEAGVDAEAEAEVDAESELDSESSTGPISITLARSEASSDEMAHALLQLRLRQAAPASFLQMGDVPLYQEVLKEKHLATYYGTVRIGDTLFRVLFDTGSCELWVPSNECTTARCKRHHRFPMISDKKPRFKLYKGATMKISYISGSVEGKMVIETVRVGDVDVPNQILGVAKTLSIELLDDVVWDGIVGLAYPSPTLVTRGVTPLFDNIIKQQILTKKQLANQFSYYIDDTQGVLTLGGVNCEFVTKNQNGGKIVPGAIEHCKNNFVFSSVADKVYWTIMLDDISLAYPAGISVPSSTKLKGFCPAAGCKAIVDTGTYLVYTGTSFQAPMEWGRFAGCGDVHNLPNITFHVRNSGGAPHALTLEPKDYVLKFNKGASTGNREDCVVGISPDRDQLFTLGQVFLRSYYTVFDRDENRIGFSRLERKKFEAVNAKPSVPPPKTGRVAL